MLTPISFFTNLFVFQFHATVEVESFFLGLRGQRPCLLQEHAVMIYAVETAKFHASSSFTFDSVPKGHIDSHVQFIVHACKSVRECSQSGGVSPSYASATLQGGFICIAHRISHGTNVVVVNRQLVSRKFFLLLCNWMLTTTFVPWDILWVMVI